MLEKNRLLWVLLITAFTAIAITSISSITDFRFFDQKRIVQAVILIFGSVLFLFFVYKYELIGLGNSVKIWASSLLCLFIISSFLAPLQSWAFLQVGWYVLLAELLLLNTYLYVSDKEKFLKVLLLGIIALCVLYSARVFADYLIGTIKNDWTTWPQQLNVRYYYKGEDITPNGFLGFGHVRFFNHLQTWSLPLLVFSYLYYKDKIIPGLRYLFLFFISSWWMLVFAADARGTILASISSIVVIVLLFRKKTISFLKIYGSTALAGLVLYLVLFLIPKESSREILTRFGDSGRWDVWLFSLEQIAQHPWLGLGPMHFSYMGINPPWSTPHNFLLQSASEWGIPAILVFTGLSLYTYYYFTKQSLELAEQEENAININWRIALITSMSAALVHSMFSGIFSSPLSQLLGTVILGAAFGEYFLASDKVLFQKRKKRKWSVYVLILVLFANTAFVGIKVASDIPYLKERQQEYMQKYRSLTLYPRFWNQGMIYERDNEGQANGKKENQDGQD